MQLDILQEGQRWVAINKPAGIGTEQHYQHDTVEARAQVQWQRPGASKAPFIGIVHRLDRPVSGVLLLARNKSTLVALNAAFAERRVRKTYWALTEKALPEREGTLRHYLARAANRRTATVAHRPGGSARESVLHYELLDEQPGYFHYAVTPITGRFHQIRAQLAAAGAPIIGDATYGSPRLVAPHTILLHARQLDFPAPAGEVVTVTAPLPAAWPETSQLFQ